MEHARPSHTALRVAMRRAAHQLYDTKPLVLEDPTAVRILGKEYRPEVEKTATKLHKAFSVALRAFLVARSRYAEDTLAKAVAAGATQYVLLGAGLDTFAFRNPYAQLRVFEVDHPATQMWKRELMVTNSVEAPSSLTFVPVDFEHQRLTDELMGAGFHPQERTVFAWLGVVPYLTYAAFRSTLDFISDCAQGSAVVMDYSQPRHALSFHEQLAHDSLAARVKQAGEPFQLFFTPEELARECGHFSRVEDMGSPEINARYFFDRTDNLKVMGSAGRLMSAWL